MVTKERMYSLFSFFVYLSNVLVLVAQEDCLLVNEASRGQGSRPHRRREGRQVAQAGRVWLVGRVAGEGGGRVFLSSVISMGVTTLYLTPLHYESLSLIR